VVLALITEHLLLAAKYLTACIIDDVPKDVRDQVGLMPRKTLVAHTK
jgi:hypothetical protein